MHLKSMWIFLITFVLCLVGLDATPPRYCLSPINITDCGHPPTPVFSYYKPGSRCEIEIWRGCPSYNRFSDEYSCSHFCIGKLTNNNEPNSEENEIKESDKDEDPCEGNLNKSDCGAKPIQIYTYDHKTKNCVAGVWKGCDTKNMFATNAKCSEICKKFGDISAWAKKIDSLSIAQLDQLNIMLDEYLEQKKTYLRKNKQITNNINSTGGS